MSEEKYHIEIKGSVHGLSVGDNNDSSFNFLKDEHFEQSKAQSLSLPIYHIPHRRNLLFTGRENLLRELRENLVSVKSIALTQPQAISGLGGIGKTQIALEYAYLYQNDYKIILWINSSSEEGIISDLIKIAERLSLQVKDEHDHIIVLTTIRNWLENNTDWLLIFDNVEDLLGVNNILPANNAGHVIVTTRLQATGTIAQSIIVEKMNENEAVLFLLRRAKVIRNEASLENVAASDITKAKEIVNLLDSLPLALDQAGAYIEETACGLAGYLERYQQQQLKLLGRRGNSPYYHPEPVTTTWSLSFEKIEQTSPLAAELLIFCSFLAPDAIPEEIITKGSAYLAPVFPSLTNDLLELDEAISILRNYSLITRNGDLKIISIHRLVQTVLREDLERTKQKQWIISVTKFINHIFPRSYIDTWDECQKYLPHAHSCLLQIKQWKIVSLEAGSLSRKVGMYFYDNSQFTEAEEFYTQSLQIISEQFGTENTLRMEICRDLSKVYYHQENFEKAETLLMNALDIAQKKLSSNHLKTVLILSDLASIYELKGESEKADIYFKKFRELSDSGRTYRNIEIVYGITKLANFYRNRGQYHQAEKLYQNILSIVEQTYGTDHFQTSQILDIMAEFYRDEGKYDIAEPLYQRTLAIFEQIFEPGHPRFTNIKNNLALLYYEKGEYDLAEPLFEEAYSLTQKIYGSNNTRSAIVLNNLALLYRDQGKYDLAILLFQRVYKLYSAVFGVISPECGNTINNLGVAYLKQDVLDKATEFLITALKVLKETRGENHPDVANVLGNLGVIHIQKKEYVQAEKLCSLALEIHKTAFGEYSFSVAKGMQSLAHIYDKQGKCEKAISLYKGTIVIYEVILGIEHSDIVPLLNSLATICMTQKKYDLAENHLQRAIRIDRKTNHPGLVILLSNLAQLYEEQEEYNQAEITNLEVVGILEETSNPNLPTILLHYEALSRILCLNKKYGKSEFFLRKALVIRRQHFEADKEGIATTLSNLGFVCERQGGYTQAKQFYGDALEIFRNILKPDHHFLRLVSQNYDDIIEKINNNAIKSSNGEKAINSGKYTHRNKIGYTQKSKKKKQRKQR